MHEHACMRANMHREKDKIEREWTVTSPNSGIAYLFSCQ